MQEISALFERRQKRLTLLQELGKILHRASEAVVALDLSQLELCTAQQRAVYEAICRLNEKSAAHSAYAGLSEIVRSFNGDDSSVEITPQMEERWNLLTLKLQRLEAQVRYANLLHGALLRRSKLTNDILSRLLTGGEPTYLPPKSLPPKFLSLQSLPQGISYGKP